MPLGLIASLLLVDFADEWFTFLPTGAMPSMRADLGLSYARIGVLLAFGAVRSFAVLAQTARQPVRA